MYCGGVLIIVSRENAEVEDNVDARGSAGDSDNQREDKKESSRSPDVELCTHQL